MKEIDDVLAELGPELQRLEGQRLELLAKRKKRTQAVLLVLAAAGLLTFLLVRTQGPVGFLAALAGVFGILAVQHTIIGKAEKEFRSGFKYEIVGAIVQQLQPGLTFAPETGIGIESFCASQLFSSKPDRYSTEDELFGTIGATEIQLAEVHAEDRRTRSSKGRTETYYVDIFKGVLLIADFHKHFNGVTRVMPDKEDGIFASLGKGLSGLFPFESKQAVRMADPEFENHFKVFSTDHVEAHYILSHGMMRRILAIREAWGNQRVRLSFVDSKVTLAIPHRGNLLEVKPRESLVGGGQIQRVVGELRECFQLVEDLNLNTRIWTKE